MSRTLPTKLGDVLILTTDRAYRTFAVGLAKAGQQDFHEPSAVKYVDSRDAALALAKALVAPGGRIFLRDLDTKEWTEL
jgi:hypothetical protein